ncbi:3-deoxy-D-manno-octulosonic acid kinase [Volucribacter psittacicida]|uniref:3-deoxy-D-manno-octulosonic acid kinase n=1 Tax=Volucribacter psittacicida TaxID=203482 RepID=A0A4R1FWR9_9PAST|nr:3-deoxy-D-manno-octulosonic acid kinase [Volucribacter psittacicida]TCJ98710.1 3-deoxy-D-manno-octulosonic acid kinase [Volucribacter psittacicida]
MQQLQDHNQYFLFNFHQPLADQQSFFEPVYWQQQAKIIGQAQGRGTTYFLQTQDLFGVNSVLRHYYRGGLIGKINRDSYHFTHLNATRSFAEFHLLRHLHQAGMNVPKPLGARVVKSSYCYRADILTEKIENAQDLTALLQHQSLCSESWQQIGQLIRQLHYLQVCHTDLNAHNILCQQTPKGLTFWLIDFDKCYEQSGDIWKKANLQRLLRSFEKEVKRMNIQFHKENWQALLAGYNAKHNL